MREGPLRSGYGPALDRYISDGAERECQECGCTLHEGPCSLGCKCPDGVRWNGIIVRGVDDAV